MLLNNYPAQALLEDGDWSAYFHPEQYDLWLVYIAVVVMAAALLPPVLKKRRVTAPIVYLLFGMVLCFLLPAGKEPNLLKEMWWVKRLSEMVVIIALTSAGLKLNKPFAKATWTHSKRLLGIAMPVTMLVTFALGYWVFGFALATAALLAAAIAPTDPVLAAEVQTSPPGNDDTSPTRVALTTEAGVNDGLAFPFTYLAIGIAVFGESDWEWLWSWFLLDFVYKIAAGFVIGWVIGWLLNKAILAFPPEEFEASVTTGILAVTLTLLPYGAAELASGYGFVAVFVAACVFRNLESQHSYQRQLHHFAEEMEGILVAVIFVLLGIYACNGLIDDLKWSHVLFAGILIFAARPLAGYLSLAGAKLHPKQRFTMSFFGIRGIGSLYYLSYALYQQEFPQADAAFALVVFTIIASVVIHGLSAPVVTRKLDKVEQSA